MELPRGLMLFSLVLSVASGPVPDPRSVADVTILTRMAEDKQVCSFPPREMLLDKSGILRSCRLGLEDDLKSENQTLEFAAINPQYLLCMGIYDLSIHICQSNVSSKALPNTTEMFERLFKDQTSAEKFCTVIKTFEPVEAANEKTATWVSILNQNLANEEKCTRICKPKSNYTNPLCNIISWGRNILTRRESTNPVAIKAPSAALSDEGLMQNGEPKEETMEPSPKNARLANTSSSKTVAATSQSAPLSSAAGGAVANVPTAASKNAKAEVNVTSAQSVSTTATKASSTQSSASQPAVNTLSTNTSDGTDGKSTVDDLEDDTTFDLEDEDQQEPKYPQTTNSNQKLEENAQVSDLMTPREEMVDEESNFTSYFLTFAIICVVGYLVFHNKQKIFALVLEGRRGSHGSRRRPNSSNYRKLNTNLEEAITSPAPRSTNSHVIY